VASGVTAEHSFDYSDCDDNDIGKIDAEDCVFIDTNDLITISNHTYKNGEVISFSEINSTTGISVATRYYVINPTINTFQISDALEGTVKSLTTNGTGKIYRCKYRQAVIHITRQNSGNDITAINFNLKHSSLSVEISSNWLDICLSAPNLASLKIMGSTSNVQHGILEKFNAVSLGAITDFSCMFSFCVSLQDVWLDTSSGTDFSLMFSECYSLQTIPLLNTSNAIGFGEMFYKCHSLKSVPLFNTSNASNFDFMFQYCTSLKSVPLFDTSSGLYFNSMFGDCFSLQSVPLFNTSLGDTFNYMFGDCFSLQSVPLFDTSLGEDFGLMFASCYALKSVPLFDTSSGMYFNSMFDNCSSLKSIPLLNLSNGTLLNQAFRGCSSLESISLLNTSNVTSFLYTFYNCYALESVPLFDTSSGTNFSRMFQNCYSLQSIPLLNVSNGSDNTSMLASCYSLSRGTLQSTKSSISYFACQLSPTALDEIFSYLASNVTTKTITVSSNWGARNVFTGVSTTTSGSTTVTMANTTGLSANMWITGTNISSSRSVTFQDTGDTVTLNNHGIPNGTRVSFTAITTTTGLTLKTIYYVVNTQTNTFQVSDTVGGTAKTLTNNGSGTLIYENYIVSVVPNTSITISIPASGSGTNTLTSTNMNPYLATLKGWTVTN